MIRANLSIGHSSNNGGHPVTWSGVENLGHRQDGVLPVAGLELAGVVLHHGVGQALTLQAVAGEPGLVREPLLVDVLVGAGQDAEDLEQDSIFYLGNVYIQHILMDRNQRKEETTSYTELIN